MSITSVTFEPIGIIHSCFRQKFGIPRQPGLVRAARGQLELLPPYNRREALTGLEGFSHLWIHFIFHQTMDEGWRPTIRPPRLGGKKRIGVFATRSTHRPNPLGMSVVRLENILEQDGRLLLEISGIDLLDQTPVVDIKPYLPYADIISDASGGFAPEPGAQTAVTFTEEALAICQQYEQQQGRQLQLLIQQILSQDPRPAYLNKNNERSFGMSLWDLNIRWRIETGGFVVYEVQQQEPCISP
ncbi:tRNA (N6-threonylcarbamoyladenosine(37)-N6)-methyltransferase TrmO [Aestuariirhabdus sp. Z084]|uniref:tRNA (N6-threonylcarbamoyladenosine(37)-N6)-methyltransferase TrmO n=1 Tax=Aestuariirhabdus haliotis TaxID=2918751 RepID=UPI00201B440F|nr:tRNA (N6-threonylcarbamoyladenosine(37)-N6)-methyltransferase TrmO [Aestuariirhabdus haliotis]MCL6417018.1 tRNA (N6-threonylcarbamoyladenosine(37)-N6)-methyltransferase TrmO [Aestuariirhabdus haliotis]MCL6421051.1 tRNA (N6-threonylcarbamoyladenosine(37)-N6)-methyltransferase TrmO [Aestuariirhabdus haliotis]